MSRSGYDDDYDAGDWDFVRYRGIVANATKGKRGQGLLRDLLDALDKLPERSLITEALIEEDGSVCALGALGKARGIDMTKLDAENSEAVAAAFGVAPALVREIVYENDESWINQTPEQRFQRMRTWVASQIREPKP